MPVYSPSLAIPKQSEACINAGDAAVLLLRHAPCIVIYCKEAFQKQRCRKQTYYKSEDDSSTSEEDEKEKDEDEGKNPEN